VRRREFIYLIGGAAAAPQAALAQVPERLRRIGVLMTTTPDEPETKARLAAFLQGLQELGWTDGRNLEIVNRWGSFSSDDLRKHAAELAGLAPDVILANGSLATGPLLQATRTVSSRSALGSSTVSRDLEGMPPDLHRSNTVRAENG